MPHNNKSIIAERRKRVAELYLEGKWQTEIAKIVGVTQQQVSHDLGVLRRLWIQSSLINIDKIKAKELAKIDRLESEHWKAWFSSVGEKIRTTETSGGKNDDEVKTETKIDAGDPRFLQGIQWCIAKRCEIFGLNAPFKLDTTSKGESTRPLNIMVDSAETAEVLQKVIDAAKNNSGISEE